MTKKVLKKQPRVLDLFSGCGGLSFGFANAGYEIVGAVDNWQDSLLTFAWNHPGGKTILADLSIEKPMAILKKYAITPGSVDVIVGGPPCQGFSISGKRNPQDPRNGLYKSFVDFVCILKPKAFVMENVPNLISMQGGKIKDAILVDFKKAGYKVEYRILKASDYGVPQIRRRVFFVGFRNGTSFEFPQVTFGSANPYITAEEAINDLPEGDIPDGDKYPMSAQSKYQETIRRGSKGVFNHEAIVHKDETRRIIAMVPDGGNYKNLPKKLRNTRKVNIAWTRLNSKKPSYTIDTGHNHLFHYKYNRVPTARESARIQSFPDSFVFMGKNKASHLKQIGNAVPPLLAEVLAKRMLDYL